MKRITLTKLIGASLVSWPLVCAAAEGERHGLSFFDVLTIVLPFAIICILALVFLPGFSRRMLKHSGIERYHQHFERVETELKRIADALEKKDKDGDHAV